jgi:hypothetical protein
VQILANHGEAEEPHRTVSAPSAAPRAKGSPALLQRGYESCREQAPDAEQGALRSVRTEIRPICCFAATVSAQDTPWALEAPRTAVRPPVHPRVVARRDPEEPPQR